MTPNWQQIQRTIEKQRENKHQKLAKQQYNINAICTDK